jgi:predicted nuclease of predicted toxin-antitoxin system
VKALFDENLSPELVTRLADVFPESVTVLRLSPRPISDARIWQHARSNGCFILTKDDDFGEASDAARSSTEGSLASMS